MCIDFNNIQNILENKNNEINILRSDVSGLVQDNNFLKQEKNKLELLVKIFLLNNQKIFILNIVEHFII